MIKFANKSLPSFVKVTDIKYSILPSIDTKLEKVYGRAGSYDFGVEIGERKIEAEVMIIANTQNDVMKKAREFSTYLFYADLQPLILLDEPDKQYMARVSGDTDVTELYRTGKATIVFTCPSPYAESLVEKEVKNSPTDYTPFNVINNGSAETYPVIDVTLKADTSSVAVITDDKFVKVGIEDSAVKTPVKVDPLVFHDPMESYSGWSTGTQIDNGIVTGSFFSTNKSIRASDYGSGSTWHGPAGIKTLSRQLQDFLVQGYIGHRQSNVNQVGRVEIYLMDINNTIIGKVAMVDNATTGKFTKGEVRAGAWQNGNYYVNSYGAKKGAFGDFANGIVQIGRVGKSWQAYITLIDSKGRHYGSIRKSWMDTKNEYSTKKLAKVQVHIGAYGEKQPVSTMYLSSLKVWEKSPTVNYDTQTPVVFSAGDVITIDNQRAIVSLNGEPIFSELDPASDFFALNQGNNGLLLSPPQADISVKYRERWL